MKIFNQEDATWLDELPHEAWPTDQKGHNNASR